MDNKILHLVVVEVDYAYSPSVVTIKYTGTDLGEAERVFRGMYGEPDVGSVMYLAQGEYSRIIKHRASEKSSKGPSDRGRFR